MQVAAGIAISEPFSFSSHSLLASQQNRIVVTTVGHGKLEFISY